MPSPFSALAPFLERALWTIFHFAFGAEMADNLLRTTGLYPA